MDSTIKFLRQKFNIPADNYPVIALAGNPNTGKSTVFNNLTGLKQHTGNWPGKTVSRARGHYRFKGKKFTIIDLPGTYSLLATSEEEKIARDFICFARPEATIVVADATNLERNLNLLLQVMEITDKVILCLNLMDEAERKGIKIDIKGLQRDLKIPVIPTVARNSRGLEKLKAITARVINNEIKINPYKISYSRPVNKACRQLLPSLKANLGYLQQYIDLKWLALRLIEGDISILNSIQYYFSGKSNIEKIFKNKKELKVDGII